MHVVATAGHVDHGKSTLVRALTGMEPDRWAEERRRGMTIDLGFAWTTLADGNPIAFVDVPGHQKFIGNMLAGVGPVPAALLVVAADEGWSRQTTEHLAALNALGVRHGVLAVSRSDLGDAELAIEEARDYLAGTSLEGIEAVAVSPVAGFGLDELRAALGRMVATIGPAPELPTRLWIDRVFTISGAGTVVTGTLATGALATGDELRLAPSAGLVHVRRLESLKSVVERTSAVARVAVNLRGVKNTEVLRGNALVAPGRWADVTTVDVRLINADARLASELVLHIGSAAVAVRLRRLGPEAARLTMGTALPLRVGDRALLRDPGHQHIAAGAIVLDIAPSALRRRGAAGRLAEELATMPEQPVPSAEVVRRGAVRRHALLIAGVLAPEAPTPPGVIEAGGWLIGPQRWQAWQRALTTAVQEWASEHPMAPSIPRSAASRAAGLPDPALLTALVASLPTLTSGPDGLRPVGAKVTFEPDVESALDELRQRLVADPFDAAEVPQLAAAGLTERHLATATRQGMLLKLAPGVYLSPTAPGRAIEVLATIDQPFTLSEARQALGTSRRVAVPLLELLDRLELTQWVDDTHRTVRPGRSSLQVGGLDAATGPVPALVDDLSQEQQ